MLRQTRRLIFFNDTATTEIYTLSPTRRSSDLPTAEHAVLALRTQQILAFESGVADTVDPLAGSYAVEALTRRMEDGYDRSEEHTSELQSRQYLVCRLLLEKKNTWSAV